MDSSAFDNTKSGTYEIKVIYKNLEVKYTVFVVERLESISVSGYKTEFVYGEEFSTGVLIVSAMYQDGTTKNVESYTVDSDEYNKNLAGDYTISVLYKENGVSAYKDYVVTVLESTVIEELIILNQNTVFANEDEFTFNGEVFLKYEDGREVKTEEYNIDSTAFKKGVAGEYQIVISAKGVSAQYTVEILLTMKIKEYYVQVQTTTFKAGDPFVFDGEISVEYEDGRVETEINDMIIFFALFFKNKFSIKANIKQLITP